MRPTFGASDGASLAVSFAAPAAVENGLRDELGLSRELLPLAPTRDVGKKDMRANDARPAIDIDPDTFAIAIDGETVTAQPAQTLPLGRLYQMF
jgi:urease subunit alpha